MSAWNRFATRAAVIALGLALALVATPWTPAQERFPSREITLIVPWPAGGGSDISMRLLADQASKEFGAPVVVVNKPGAAGCCRPSK